MITPTSITPLAFGPHEGSLFFSSSSMQSKRQHQRSDHLHHRDLVRVGGVHSNNAKLMSASIPLPASHVHRTRSEIQLADDTSIAEYEDVRMCIRLVVGMQSQCLKSGGEVHPMTTHSLREVLRTKAAKDIRELEERRLREQPHHQGPEENEEWNDIDDLLVVTDTTTLPSSVLSVLAKTASRDDGGSGMRSIFPTNMCPEENEEYEDDDCVFCLEL